MQITGKDFGPVYVNAKGGMIVAADRPVSYMRGWELKRAVALAERWHWKLPLSDDERGQLEQHRLAIASSTKSCRRRKWCLASSRRFPPAGGSCASRKRSGRRLGALRRL